METLACSRPIFQLVLYVADARARFLAPLDLSQGLLPNRTHPRAAGRRPLVLNINFRFPSNRYRGDLDTISPINFTR